MSYVRIVLRNRPITRDEERQLFARAVEVMPALSRNNGDSTMVSVEHVSKPEDFLREDKPRAVDVQLHNLSETISAEDRARITWGAIDMLRDVLGTAPDTTYQVDIEARPADGGRTLSILPTVV